MKMCTLLHFKAKSGQTLLWRGTKIVILSVVQKYIDDDDPSLYGNHLLGYEGHLGYLITYREAS